MERGRLIERVTRHAVAMGVTFAVLFALPAVAGITAVIVDNDAGGPMFLPLFVLLCALGAVCGTLAACVASLFLQWSRGRYAVPWWPAAVLIGGATCAAMFALGDLGSTAPWRLRLVSSLGAVLAFSVYSLALAFAGRLIGLLGLTW